MHVFREVPDDGWTEVEPLVMNYIRSRAFCTTIDQMLWSLDDANPVPVDLIIHIVRQTISDWKKHSNKPRRIEKLRWGSNSLSQHLRVAYTNAANGEQRGACLDLMDEMLFIGFHGIKDLIAESE